MPWEIIEELKNKRDVEGLIAALQDGDLRKAAAEALVSLGPQAVKPLIALLRDDVLGVRKAAAEALGKIGDPQAVKPLIALVRDDDWYVREAAAEALGKIGDPEEVGFLMRDLADRDEDVQYAGAKTLISALAGESWYARYTAAVALVRMIRDRELDRAVYKALVAFLEDQDVKVRYAAAKVIGIILSALKDEHWGVSIRAAKTPEKRGDRVVVERQLLRAIFRDDDWGVDQALAELGGPRAVKALVRLLEDEDVKVRYAAAEALEGLEERFYFRACVDSKKWLIRSKHTRRSRKTAEREAKQMAHVVGGAPNVEFWLREHGLRPRDPDGTVDSYAVHEQDPTSMYETFDDKTELEDISSDLDAPDPICDALRAAATVVCAGKAASVGTRSARC
jgi:HEAT repeat protein